jgi:hypothetical protein
LVLYINWIFWAPVALACNPRYSRNRDQEDRVSKPAWANNSPGPISNTLPKNRAGGVAAVEGSGQYKQVLYMNLKNFQE